MRGILSWCLWVSILAATGFFIGTHSADAGVPPVHCETSTIHATVGLDGNTIVLQKVTICSNGRVTLVGRGLRCTKAGSRTVRVGGRTARISGTSCR